MDEQKIITAIKKYHGNVSKAAESVGIARSTMYLRIDKSDIIKEAIEDARESRNGDVQDTLYKLAVQDENVTALIFIAKTQMNWKETQKIEQETELNVTVIRGEEH